MESYVDESASDDWRKVNSVTDIGNWTSDSETDDEN
jgi:hypothetical protein